MAAGYGDTAILSKIRMNLVPGSRIGLLGRNGAGKSTLIKTLSRDLPPLSGEFEHSKHLRIGYFAQHQLDTLKLGQSPADHVQALDNTMTEQMARDYLGGYGFNGDQALDKIDNFSGGEKARLVLALIVFQKPNLLLLDEPTNHLDIEMRQALAIALQGFEGAMILIAHDRHLLKSTCDDLYLVDSGQVAPFDGDLDDYHTWLLDQERQANQNKEEINDKANSAMAKKDQKRKEAELRKALSPIKKKADKLVLQQEKMTKRLSEIEEAMGDTELYTESRKSDLNQLLSEQASLKSELDDIEMEWFEYEEQMEVMRSEYDESN